MSKQHYSPSHVDYYKITWAPWATPRQAVGGISASSFYSQTVLNRYHYPYRPTLAIPDVWTSTSASGWWHWILPYRMRLQSIKLSNAVIDATSNTESYYASKNCRIYSDATKTKAITAPFTMPQSTAVLTVPVLADAGIISEIFIYILDSYGSRVGFKSIVLVGEYESASVISTSADYDYSVVVPTTDATQNYHLIRAGKSYSLMRAGKPYILRR